MINSKTLVGASGLLMVVALATPGCATKKYVRQQVGTVDQRVSDVDKKHADALTNLEGKEQKDVSRVEERAMGAENRANDAARAAQAADQKATQAGDAAKNATELAQQAQARIGDVSNAVQNIDTYKLLTSDDVLFGFNRATLTKEGQAKLDSLVQQTQGNSRYIIEVQGFTDRTGPQDYNLALSRRRADTVVRYIVDHGVPLRRIHMLGLGEMAADGRMPGQQAAGMQSGQAMQTDQTQTAQTGKMSRKEMRRVVVNIYVPETTLSASSGSPQSQQMSQPSMQQPTSPSQSQPTEPSPSPR